MIQRPEKVGEALVLEADGTQTGRYGPFRLHSAYQPIFALQNPRIAMIGVEALVRVHSENGWISPAEFFSRVEPDDRFFIEFLCRALHMRNFALLNHASADLYINLDPSTYGDLAKTEHELDVLIARMQSISLDPGRFVCEIIETKAASPAILKAIVERLRSNGVRIAIDDFGAEHSDHDRVSDLRPDFVKLDRLWMNRLMRNETGIGALKQITQRFMDMEIKVIFEGIETRSELEFAQSTGAYAAQGYLMCSPKTVPATFQEHYSAPENSQSQNDSPDT